MSSDVTNIVFWCNYLSSDASVTELADLMAIATLALKDQTTIRNNASPETLSAWGSLYKYLFSLIHCHWHHYSLKMSLNIYESTWWDLTVSCCIHLSESDFWPTSKCMSQVGLFMKIHCVCMNIFTQRLQVL